MPAVSSSGKAHRYLWLQRLYLVYGLYKVRFCFNKSKDGMCKYREFQLELGEMLIVYYIHEHKKIKIKINVYVIISCNNNYIINNDIGDI